MRIKINPLDKLCSQIVRLRSKGICEIGGEYKGFDSLMACHCFGRANKRVRYDLDNMVAGCFGHHQKIDSDPELKRYIFIRKLGLENYNKLCQRANWPTMKKIDKKAIKLFLEQELQKYAESPLPNP